MTTAPLRKREAEDPVSTAVGVKVDNRAVEKGGGRFRIHGSRMES